MAKISFLIKLNYKLMYEILYVDSDNMYKVTVIMPVYNGENLIKLSIDSLLNQTIDFNNIELNIVDDYSTDNSRRIIQSYSKKYNNINHYFLEKNYGPGKPRNVGIENATSKYIMFLDCGDTYSNNYCEILYKNMEENNVDFVSSRFLIHDKNNIFPSDNLLESYFLGYSKNNIPISFFSAGYIFSSIFKKELLLNKNIRFPEDKFPEDNIFTISYYFESKNYLYLIDYWGYNYFIYDNSFSRKSHSINDLEKFIKGFYRIKELFELHNEEKVMYLLIPYLMHGILFTFIFTSMINFNSKKIILKEIYKYENSFENDLKFDLIFEKIFNKLIMLKMFNLAVLFSNILGKLSQSKNLTKFYRKYINN